MADADAKRGSKAARPLSPHITIYRPPVNMVMSIIHRLTGAALYVGTVLAACVLIAAASGPEAFDTMTGLLATWPGQIVLIGYTWALLHHLVGGVRHFIWDTGHGYDLATVDLLSWGTLAVSVTATLSIWGYLLLAAGGTAP